MFVTHERLEMLKAQQEHLLAMHSFTVAAHMIRLGKAGVSNDDLQSEAILEADDEFEDAGLNQTAARIRLEIAFLESELLG